jgi:hypothetical protein
VEGYVILGNYFLQVPYQQHSIATTKKKQGPSAHYMFKKEGRSYKIRLAKDTDTRNVVRDPNTCSNYF